MPNEPNWLTAANVIEFNRQAVEQTGESHALLDRGKLDGAVARPQQIYAYGSHHLADLAVALLFGIARAHAFEQGNKRTGMLAADVFLQVNGYTIGVDSLDLAEGVVEVLAGQRTEASFCALLEMLVVPVEA